MTDPLWTNPTGRIDAVIVDYQTPELARDCATSLLEHRNLFARISLVDAHARGLSYAQAVNGTLAGGPGDIILALNADTRMLETPTAVLNLFDEDPRVAVVGPRQVSSAGMITHGGILGTNERPGFRCWQQPLATCEEETADTCDAITVSGSVYFARRAVWKQLGGFLQTRHFYEETWFSYLARHHGHRVLYTGQTTWIHEFNQSPTSGQWRGRVAVESRETFRAACAREGITCD